MPANRDTDAGAESRGAVPLHKVQTVQHATLSWLRQQIASGRYEPLEQLRQENLARDFGVSVPPVREALQTLEAEGQVVYYPRRGYFVAKLSAEELVETYAIRDLLETEATMRSVGSLGKDDIARMRSAVKEMEQAHRGDDLATMTAANRRFHFTVFDAAEMPRMTDMIRVLWESTDRYRSVYYASAQHRRRVNAEHRAIMTAVADGNAERAAVLLREHRHHALDALCESLPSDAEPTSHIAAHTKRAN
jgi:DNA-binding GntR family transcriptional regulator